MNEATETLGQRLRAQRERKGMSTQKAADQLHLDGWVIEALENGDYARLGPAVYGKGHLKRYAGLLGLPAAEVLEAYDTRSVPAAAQSSTLRTRSAAAEQRRVPWASVVAGIAGIAVIAAAVAWRRPWQPATGNNASSAVASAQPDAVNGEPGGDRGIHEGAPSGAAPAPAPAPASASPSPSPSPSPSASPAAGRAPGLVPVVSSSSAPRAAVAPGTMTAPGGVAAAGEESASTAGAGRARLRLSFSSDSWVDVRDASGRRLYAGYGRANSVRSIAGAAPLKVYLGFASGVQLEVNNHAVAIGSQFVAGGGARFAAGADGVLRVVARDTPSNPRPRG
ncbi:MAG: DUF4115 domain-containing protein [Pseudomonadota bacterium]|nr:DUF4115 domain-containing protein [Pseudomonadota bacterium]